MLTLRRRTISTAVLTLALGWAVAGCSSDDGGTTPGTDPVVGTWNVTSFLVNGTEFIAGGLGVSFVFNSNGTYALNFTNDQGDFCSPGDGGSCDETGTYTTTDTTIILDAGTTDEATLNYLISGSTMTFNTTIDGDTIVVVMDKV